MQKLIRNPFSVVCMLSVWWLLFIALAVIQFTGLRSVSDAALMLFIFFTVSFFVGGVVSSFKYSGSYFENIQDGALIGTRMLGGMISRLVVCFLLIVLAWQILIMLKVGFFDYTYIEYNRMLRAGEEYGYITKSKYGDHFYKLVLYPFLSLMYLVALAGLFNRVTILLVVINIILFCALWQVNYPLIFMVYTAFLSYIFFSPSWFSKVIWPILFLGLFLVSAAFIRYGGVSWGVFEHYFVNYNIIGFIFFDAKLGDSDSVLHEMSYGRSTLGAIDQYVDLFFRSLGSEYLAASIQNVNDNMHQIDIGESEEKLVNAFGTMAFTFYRDFLWLGIIAMPFIYGYFLIYNYAMSPFSWRHKALFFLLTYGWLTGNSVSPFDQVYFVFAIFFLAVIFRFRVRTE